VSDQLDEKLARLGARVAAQGETVRSELERIGALELATALRETFGAKLAPMQRRHDPPTSRIAAERLVASGRADAHRRLIVDAIRRRPGTTYRQIADMTGLEPVAVGRRLVEVERQGLAKAGEARAVEGRLMRTWWPL
jgi:CRP-like cAMP-binding protein